MSATPTGGSPQDLVVVGQTAFVAVSELGVLAFDVSDPEAPRLLSTLATDGAPDALAAVGHHVVAVGDLTMQIIDIGDPAAPVIVGSLALPSEGRDVAVEAGTAYVALDHPGNGLVAVDISDPAMPEQLSFHDAGDSVQRVTVEQGTAFLGLGPYGMVVLDVSDPSRPVRIGAYDGSRVYELAIEDQVGYTATWYGMAAIDLADPSQPQLLWEGDAIRGRTDMTLAGGLAFMDGASAVYDITAPGAPLPVGEFPVRGRESVVRDELAYVITADSLIVMDVSDPGPSGVLSAVELADSEGLAVRGTHAFVSSWLDGLVVFDISDPAHPLRVASLEMPGTAHHLDIAGDYVYIAVTGRCLAIVDVSDPTAPVLAGPPPSYGGSRVGVGDGVAVVIGSQTHILDVSDPSHPVHLATHPGSARQHGDVRVAGGYAFHALRELRVFDLSDPQAEPVATLDDWTALNAVDVQGDLACVAGRFDLVLLDVSDPSDPRALGRLDLPSDPPQSVKLAGDLAIVGLASRGLWMVDISDPAAPRLIASTDRWVESEPVFDVDIDGHDVRVVTGRSMRILDLSDCTCPADFNADGAVNTQDFIAFLAAWADQRGDDCSAGDCSSDLNADGVVNAQDFVEFLNLWAAGC